ncbi:amidase [Paraferrimonas sedimenticola]|uniref:Amidase n=1 Tax=Paraferrimonas sedimenticola TaxID=375674 RepID=A0AA37RWF6_9GAMM|nr:amidase [Paraferrimonas sedimenticola]GLP96308.1 amidase [Paraferrimonas sedimenticola]
MKFPSSLKLAPIALAMVAGNAFAAEFTQQELAYMPANTQIELFKSGMITPVDVLKAQKAQFEATNKTVNAVTYAHWDDAMKAAQEATKRYEDGTYRELEGITLAVKDEHHDAGWRVTFGSKLHLEDEVMPEADELVARMKDAGAIPVIQTTVPELYFNWVTDTDAWGTSRNPWNPDYAVGGSSGGSGAALAAGYATIASGSDMGGSIRIPSSFNGLYGLKPAAFTVPSPELLGHYVGSGPIARSFEDMVMFYNVIAGPGEHLSHPTVAEQKEQSKKLQSLEGMKIAYIGGMGISPMANYVADGMQNAIEVLRKQGATVDVIDFDFEMSMTPLEGIAHLAFGGALGGALLPGYEGATDQMTSYTGKLLEKAMKTEHGAVQLAEMQAEVQKMWNNLADATFKKGYDVVIAPTMPTVSVPADYNFVTDAPIQEDGHTYSTAVGMDYTLPFNLLGWLPVASVPAGQSPEGVPFGMQIIGKPSDTDTVMKTAGAYSKGAPKLYKGDKLPKFK